MKLTDQLIRDEGSKSKPYKDTVGKLTIGVGRNLDDVGLSDDEIAYLLANDIKRSRDALLKALPWVAQLDPVRQDCLVNMTFNMGIAKLIQFKNTLALIQAGKYTQAAVEMLNSSWAKQVGARAKRLADQMESGVMQ